MRNEKSSDEWDVVLSEVMFGYNRSEHCTTGITPYILMFGVKAPIASEIPLGVHEIERTHFSDIRTLSWHTRLQNRRSGESAAELENRATAQQIEQMITMI